MTHVMSLPGSEATDYFLARIYNPDKPRSCQEMLVHNNPDNPRSFPEMLILYIKIRINLVVSKKC